MTSVATRAKNLNDTNGGRQGPRHPCDYAGSTAERMDFVMSNLIGHAVSVQVKDGAIWEGILSAGWWQEGVKGLLLKQAKKMVKRDEKAFKPLNEHIVLRDDFVRMSTKVEVDLYNEELTEAARRRGGGVEVDSEIEVSGGRAAFGTERDLVMASAWVSDSDGALEGLSSGSGGGVQRGWDQFAVNKQLGVTSSYSDELYTTKISDKKFSAEQLRRAERLAKEIESGTTSNAHIAEERGQKELDEGDGDMDEEDKYSMVLAPGRKTGAAATPDVSDAKKPTEEAAETTAAPAAAATPASAPASESAPGAADSAPSPAATLASRFGTSKLRAAAKEFVPGGATAVAATPPTTGAAPTGPPQMVNPSYMGGSPQGMAPGMVPMGVQHMGMGYANSGMPMHGTGYMQGGVHPGMPMTSHPQYQQMAMAQQQQQQQQYAAAQAAQQQQQQMAMVAQQQRGQVVVGPNGQPVMLMPQQMMPMQPGMPPMQQRGMSPAMAQGRGPQGYPMQQQMNRGGYPGAPPSGYPQKAPPQQQPPPPPTPPQ